MMQLMLRFLIRVIVFGLICDCFVVHQSISKGKYRLDSLHFFGSKSEKVTNPNEEVTDVGLMRLRVKSPDGRNSFPVGDLEFELFGKTSPNGVQVFKQLIENQSYEDKTFHRIIRGFVVQAGEGCEFTPYEDDEAGLALKFGVGALAMSNAGEPNSGNGEFFITTARADELDGKYVIIGRIKSASIQVLKEVEKYGDVEGYIFNDVVIVGAQISGGV